MLTFPLNPSIGDRYTVDNKTWEWDGITWKLLAASKLSLFGENAVELLFFGDGSDGDVTISSGTITLSRDTYYNNLTINGTGQLRPNSFKVFVAGKLDLTEAPVNAINGGSTIPVINNTGTGATGIGATQQTGTLGVGGIGIAGVSGGTPAGKNGGKGGSPTTALGGLSGKGGDGGAGSAGDGGIGGENNTPKAITTHNLFKLSTHVKTVTTVIDGGCSGGSGASGGGDGTNAGGGGGGASHGGRVVYIACKELETSQVTAQRAISVYGGAGGNTANFNTGNRGSGGGAGGGGGGVIYCIVGKRLGPPVTNLMSANGGNGGNAGNAAGTGLGGQGGQGGGSGRIIVFDLTTDTCYHVPPSEYAGDIPEIPTTATGSAGSAGIQSGLTY
jgi:hypothetical protein